MHKDLAHLAVVAALSGDWDKAIDINKDILKEDKENTDALNRLARAYAESGDTTKAIKISQKVIRIDPYNSIAIRCMEKWKGLDHEDKSDTARVSSVNDFIEEPGKTKLVALIHIGNPKLLSKIDSGDEVRLNPHGHRMSVCTHDGKYIGRLPDDIGAKLKILTKMGNEYKVIIKCSEPKVVRVFIREIKSTPELKDIPSFTHDKVDYISFTPPELVHKKSDSYYVEEETT